jgi:3-dehydroquinate synthase
MVKNLSIKSSMMGYQVKFSNNFVEELAVDIQEPCAIFIDENVYHLYKSKLEKIIDTCDVFQVEAIESNKTLQFVEKAIIYLLSVEFKRNSTLIAIGGGITQDIACYIASTLFRGVQWKFYPTTLLAQADSCIGSKSSINVGHYKNQLGTFYPPQNIVIDTNFTKTLKKADIISGLGEAVKVHYLDDELRYRPIFDYYKSKQDLHELKKVIYNSLLLKKKRIELDEFDKDYRNIMNYGHTFGHAIESVTEYRVPHGIAVVFGIGLANYCSLKLGYLSEDKFLKMESLVQKICKDYTFKITDINAFWMALKKDKKNIDTQISFIFTKGFGKMFKQHLDLTDDLKNILIQYLEQIHVL